MAKSSKTSPMDKIDFELDQKFYNSLAEDELSRYEKYLFFFPILCLNVLYEYLNRIIDRRYAEIITEIRKRRFQKFFPPPGFISLDDIKDPFYPFVYAIMRDDIKTVRNFVDKGKVEVNQPIFDKALFTPFILAPEPLEKNISGFTPLNISASLGRHEIFMFLIENGADPIHEIQLIGVKAYYIFLTVNECLLMNAIFKWYKSGREKPIPIDRAKKLINSIILASKACPSLVSYDHLIENTIRVRWYWDELKRMVKDQKLLNRLVTLNPFVFKKIFYL